MLRQIRHTKLFRPGVLLASTQNTMDLIFDTELGIIDTNLMIDTKVCIIDTDLTIDKGANR